MGVINRVPLGLQDLLGSSNQGDNPSNLAEIVAPVLDLQQYLAAERRFFQLETAVQQFSDGQGGLISVPAGELWFIDAFSVFLTLIGNDPFDCHLSVAVERTTNTNQTGNHAIAGFPRFQSPRQGGFGISMTHEFPRPLPMFSSEIALLFLAGGDFTGTNAYTTRFSCRYVKLLV